MHKEVLNIVQSPAELSEMYGKEDRYWYLSSQPFIEAFIKPMAVIVNGIGLPVLDAGCGEGILGSYCQVPYVGFDGSNSALDRGRKRNPQLDLRIGRIESPELLLPSDFGTIVFGGLFSVLVKPECQVAFIERYAAFKPQFFIVYDLERTNTDRIDLRFSRITERHATADIELQPDVKRHRKILVYRWT